MKATFLFIDKLLGFLHALAWTNNTLRAGHVCLHTSTPLFEPIFGKNLIRVSPLLGNIGSQMLSRG
jgi:hypothetical protein